jgi:hypothetical protein
METGYWVFTVMKDGTLPRVDGLTSNGLRSEPI